MDDKYIFGIVGIVLGSLLSTSFAIVKEIYAENRSKKKEADYLAIRLICIFDSFTEKCASVSSDFGQPDSKGYYSIREKTPKLNINIEGANWKSLAPELTYEVFNFPNIIKYSERIISEIFEFDAFPPDYSEGFEQRQLQYAELGILASELTAKLRKKHKIPESKKSKGNTVEYLYKSKERVNEIRLKRNNLS